MVYIGNISPDIILCRGFFMTEEKQVSNHNQIKLFKGKYEKFIPNLEEIDR